jgi:hypothetical protein
LLLLLEVVYQDITLAAVVVAVTTQLLVRLVLVAVALVLVVLALQIMEQQTQAVVLDQLVIQVTVVRGQTTNHLLLVAVALLL